jgi:ABC-type proline/glycine betaine transport system permease subunit
LLERWLRQAIPLLAVLVIGMVIFSLGVAPAGDVAMAAFLALAVLLINRGPL